MNGDRAVIAKARAPLAVERGQHGDGRVGAGEHEVQLAEGLQGRRVGIAGGRDRAAERAGDEIRRQVVPPRAVRAERRRLDHHQLRTLALRGGQIGRFDSEAAGTGEHRVGIVHERGQPGPAVRRLRIKRHHAAAAGEEGVPQGCPVVVRPALP